MILARRLITPASSPSFKIPKKKVITPAKGSASFMTADSAESNIPSIIILKISVSPKKINLNSATRNATRKKPIQI